MATSRKAGWNTPDLSLWKAWSPQDVRALLEGLDVPWCIVGGWAIDLFLGRQSRAHGDLELATTRAAFPELSARLTQFRLFEVASGKVRELDSHEHPGPEQHQVWAFDKQNHTWCFDVMIEPGDLKNWVFRRNPLIKAPRRAITSMSPDGVPYLKPEAVLLFKSRDPRPKDQADFEASLPLMREQSRKWLRERLSQGHPWRRHLEALHPTKF